MTTTNQPAEPPTTLNSHFADIDASLHGQRWDDLYANNWLPWDKGFANPAFSDLLTERQDLLPKSVRGKRLKALVPGCGKGYDVLLLKAFGYDAYGLEVSSRALDAARTVERERVGDEVYKSREGREGGNATWVNGDFFGDEFLKQVEGEGKFDLIYDYTFLSALPPSMRARWSMRFKELLAPQGRIVCVEFPTYKPPSTGGPPWALPPKVYLGHLSRPGEELPYDDEEGLLESKLGEPSKDGLQRIAHFQPKRTHQIGYNAEGKVTDWVSVWAYPAAL